MKPALLFILNVLSMFAHGQLQLHFERFGTDQGLSQNVVYDLHQDSKGFLWIATHDGLNRYDGYEFKKYYHIPGDSNSLGNNTVLSVKEDADGYLWITTLNYLHHLEPSTGVMKRFPFPTDTGRPQNKQHTLPAAMKDMIPVFSPQFSALFDKRLHIFYPLPVNKNFTWMNPLYDSEKKLAGLYAVDENDQCITAYDYSTNRLEERSPGFFPGKKIRNAMFSSSGLTWGIDDAFQLLSSGNGQSMTSNIMPARIKLPGLDKITAVATDRFGNGYIALRRNIYYFQRATSAVVEIVNKTGDHLSSGSHISSVLVDKTDNVWVGTFGQGLVRFNPHIQTFHSLVPSKDSRISISGRFLKTIVSDNDGSVFLAFNDTTDVNIIDNTWQKVNTIKRSDFFASAGRYLLQLHRQTDLYHNEEVKELTAAVKELPSPVNPYIFRDKTGEEWLRTATAIINTSRDNLTIETGTFIQTNTVDRNNNIWLGTAGRGLLQVNANTVAKKEYRYSDANGLPDNTVNCMLYDSLHHRLFLGTNNGLSIFDISAENFINYTVESGLCHKNIYSMVFDDHGRLWLGTGNGLSMFDMNNRSFTNYNKADGLVNSEYNRYCAVRKPNGELVFGGTAGIDHFLPLAINMSRKAPQVEITDVYVFNKRIPVHNPVRLSHTENNLVITFSAMDFTNPGRNKYLYRLKETDKQWTLLEGRGYVSYSSLSPGHYTFEVKSAAFTDDPGQPVTTFLFSISKPWWKTGWFFFTVSLVIATVIFLLFQYRLRKKMEVLQLRSRIHRDLHDDIGATLSTIKAYSEMLRQHPDKKEYLEQIAGNTDEMLDKLEVITWANNPENDSFSNLLEKVKLAANPIFYHKGIELEFNIAPGVAGMILPGPVRQNIFLIIKEALNNVVKHAAADYCSITINKQRSQFIMQIKDNGKGISNDNKKANGNGLVNMQKRVSELGGQFTIVSTAGTIIDIRLPFPFKIRQNGHT